VIEAYAIKYVHFVYHASHFTRLPAHLQQIGVFSYKTARTYIRRTVLYNNIEESANWLTANSSCLFELSGKHSCRLQ